MQKPKQGYKLVKWLFGKEIEIPEEWEIKKIIDLTKVSVGLVINPSTYFDENGTVPMITGKNVTENGIVLYDVDFITEKSNKLLETTRIWSGDLVTMRVGYPGRTSVVKNEHDGINCASVIITRGSKKFVSEFLGYLANSRLISKQIIMHQAGGAQQVVNTGSWKEFLIPFPSIQEQQKMAYILSNVDDLISSYNNIIDSTKKLKKGLMQQLLTKGIGHKKFRDSEVGKIPEGWIIETLGNVCQIRKENKINSDLYVGLEHLSQGTNLLVGRGNVTQFTSTKNTFKKGDVLYGKLRPLLNKVWLSMEDGYCSTDILPLKVNDKLDNRILVKLLTSPDFVLFASSTSAGTKMPRTNWSDIQKYKIKLPSISEQQKIAFMLDGVDSKISELESKKMYLETLKKGLMQKLLTGQIRIRV